MKPPAMKLLNCTRCDDVVKLVETLRSCECECSSGKTEFGGTEVHLTGPARVLTIDWEVYDGLAEGNERPFGVLPRALYRGRG